MACASYFREEEFKELDDTKWVDEFSSDKEKSQELSDTAKELLGSVNDPKFSNSEVMSIYLIERSSPPCSLNPV